MAFEIEHCLRTLVQHEGSDLHLKVGTPPMARINGALQPLPGSGGDERLEPEDTEAALRDLLSDDRTREEFASDGEADFAYAISGVSRFRVNAFRQRGSVSIVCRAIPFQVRTIEDLGLPPVIRELADQKRGIVLLTGTTGSGKTTTLAAMIDHINNNYANHIITLEDPIEYLHRDKKAIVNQREVGSDTIGFGRAMRRVLRQDPDVILVGEMRDEETVRTALSAAETGHLVLSTLHTLDATETINRIIDFFPPHLQKQARVMLASTLKGAVSQRLIPTRDGQGRVAASEVMVVTGRVQDLILNPEETGKISQVIAEGEYYGMQTFDQALLEKVTAGEVSEEVALEYASAPHDFKLMLASAGRRASDLSQLEDYAPDAAPEPEPEPSAAAESAAAPEGPASAAPEEPSAAPIEPPSVAPEPSVAPIEPPGVVPEEPSVAPIEPPSVPAEPRQPEPVEAHIDYGSPEHAFGGPVSESEEVGGEDGAAEEAPPALGREEYSEVWEPAERNGDQATEEGEDPTPRPASADGQDRLAEFRPENFKPRG